MGHWLCREVNARSYAPLPNRLSKASRREGWCSATNSQDGQELTNTNGKGKRGWVTARTRLHYGLFTKPDADAEVAP